MNTPKRYHPALVTLHWLTVIIMLSAGFLADDEGDSPISIHMILGAILLVIMVARLIVRFATPRPDWADTGNKFLNLVGELTHLALYLVIFGILGLGGLIAYNRNLFAYILDNTARLSRAGGIQFIHKFGWDIALVLITLHVAAALYHQFIIRDNLLARMWYGRN